MLLVQAIGEIAVPPGVTAILFHDCAMDMG